MPLKKEGPPPSILWLAGLLALLGRHDPGGYGRLVAGRVGRGQPTKQFFIWVAGHRRPVGREVPEHGFQGEAPVFFGGEMPFWGSHPLGVLKRNPLLPRLQIFSADLLQMVKIPYSQRAKSACIRGTHSITWRHQRSSVHKWLLTHHFTRTKCLWYGQDA